MNPELCGCVNNTVRFISSSQRDFSFKGDMSDPAVLTNTVHLYTTTIFKAATPNPNHPYLGIANELT